MSKKVHINKETWEKDGLKFARSWCSLKTIVNGTLAIVSTTDDVFPEENICRNCLRAKNRKPTFIVTSGHNYTGNLSNEPARFRFRKCYHLSKGKKVEFKTLGQEDGRWLNGIVDDFINQPNHKSISISKITKGPEGSTLFSE